MRQNYNYTCGVASALTIKQLLRTRMVSDQPAKKEQLYVKFLGVKEETGLDNDKLLEFCLKDDVLGDFVISSGTDTYHGGLAILNIKNPLSGIGHYVVAIYSTKKNIYYYDPIDGQIHNVRFSDLIWESGDGSLKNWSINFSHEAFQAAKSLNPKNHRKYFIVYGDHDDADPSYDTVPFVYDFLFHKNMPVSIAKESSISIVNDELYIDSMRVLPNDVVWLKMDPRRSLSYFDILRSLVIFESKIKFINKPSVILKFDDKTIYNKTSTRMIGYKKELSKFLFSLEGTRLVLKEFNSFGGKNIYFGDADKLKNIMQEDQVYIIEEDVSRENCNNEDVRVFWVEGDYVGAIKRTSNGHELCNLSSLSDEEKNHLSDFYQVIDLNSFFEQIPHHLKKHLQEISDKLWREGVVIAGVDVLNEKIITEVNISNPSVFKQYIEETTRNFLEKTL